MLSFVCGKMSIHEMLPIQANMMEEKVQTVYSASEVPRPRVWRKRRAIMERKLVYAVFQSIQPIQSLKAWGYCLIDLMSEMTAIVSLLLRESICNSYTQRRIESSNRLVAGRVFPSTDGMAKPPTAPQTIVRHPAIVIASKKLRYNSALASEQD